MVGVSTVSVLDLVVENLPGSVVGWVILLFLHCVNLRLVKPKWFNLVFRQGMVIFQMLKRRILCLIIIIIIIDKWFSSH